ncbi:hypothetical protein Tco_0055194, partial [Tanacetum coccineum]
MPKFAPMFKKMLNNKDKLIELTKTPLNENCSAVVLKKLPEKLGASINLMPLSIWKNLQLSGLTMASFEDVNSFLARNTPPDHLIRIYFEQIGVVPKVVFNILEKLVLLLRRHPFNNEILRV